MAEFSDFITAHPWLTFGGFLVAWTLASNIGGRRCCHCRKDEDDGS